MNWYVAKLVFRVISGNGDHNAQFDEQLRLINADTEQQAFEKASSIGHANQDSFLNVQKQTVKWQFIDVAELNAISGVTTVPNCTTTSTKPQTRTCTLPGHIINRPCWVLKTN